MAAIETYEHDPADVLDYPWDWQGGEKPFLAPGATIATSTFAVYDLTWEPSTALTIVDSDNDETTAQARVAVNTGQRGEAYYVTNHVVDSTGQEKDWSIKIKIKEQ